LNRSIPTVRTFHGCALNEAKFADNLKAKLVHSVYHPLELWASNLAEFSVGVGDDTIKLLGAKSPTVTTQIYFTLDKVVHPNSDCNWDFEGA